MTLGRQRVMKCAMAPAQWRLVELDSEFALTNSRAALRTSWVADHTSPEDSFLALVPDVISHEDHIEYIDLPVFFHVRHAAVAGGGVLIQAVGPSY